MPPFVSSAHSQLYHGRSTGSPCLEFEEELTDPIVENKFVPSPRTKCDYEPQKPVRRRVQFDDEDGLIHASTTASATTETPSPPPLPVPCTPPCRKSVHFDESSNKVHIIPNRIELAPYKQDVYLSKQEHLRIRNEMLATLKIFVVGSTTRKEDDTLCVRGLELQMPKTCKMRSKKAKQGIREVLAEQKEEGLSDEWIEDIYKPKHANPAVFLARMVGLCDEHAVKEIREEFENDYGPLEPQTMPLTVTVEDTDNSSN